MERFLSHRYQSTGQPVNLNTIFPGPFAGYLFSIMVRVLSSFLNRNDQGGQVFAKALSQILCCSTWLQVLHTGNLIDRALHTLGVSSHQ
jgi:hypothetical protein